MAAAARPFPPGIHPPSLTWFQDNEAQDVDWDLQKQHLQFLVESGVHGGAYLFCFRQLGRERED